MSSEHVLDMEMHEPLKPLGTRDTHTNHSLDVVVLKFTLLNIKQHRIKTSCCLYSTTRLYRGLAACHCPVFL